MKTDIETMWQNLGLTVVNLSAKIIPDKISFNSEYVISNNNNLIKPWHILDSIGKKNNKLTIKNIENYVIHIRNEVLVHQVYKALIINKLE